MSHDDTSLLMWLVQSTCSVCLWLSLLHIHQISLAKQDQQPELCKPSAFNCLSVWQGTKSVFLKRVTNQETLSYNLPAPHTQAKPLELAWAAAWFCLPSPSRKTGSPVPHWLHKHWMSSSWSIVTDLDILCWHHWLNNVGYSFLNAMRVETTSQTLKLAKWQSNSVCPRHVDKIQTAIANDN